MAQAFDQNLKEATRHYPTSWGRAAVALSAVVKQFKVIQQGVEEIEELKRRAPLWVKLLWPLVLPTVFLIAVYENYLEDREHNQSAP